MIAHRVTSIETATNLLVFKGRSELVTMEKGTPEFDEVIESLRNIQNKDEEGGDDDDEESSEETDEAEVERLEKHLVSLYSRNRMDSNATRDDKMSPMNQGGRVVSQQISPTSNSFFRRFTKDT